MKRLTRTLVAGLCLGLASTTVTANTATFDVMVLYTPDALDHPNGRDMNARIVSAVEWTNQAYRNSRINARLRLVYIGQYGQNRMGNLTNSHLASLRQNASVSRVRQQHGADFVTLIGPSTAWCGLGYVPQGISSTGQFHRGAGSLAYSLVSISCGHTTFAHELGHNMGLGHSNAQGSSGGVWNWARGHGERGSFVTIMGYTSAFGTSNRLQYFSNPNLAFSWGSRIGVPWNQPMGADSTLNINLLRNQLADFMPARYAIQRSAMVTAADSFDEGGTSHAPEWQPLVSGTGACMDVEDGATSIGARVNPARCTTGDNQRWQLDSQQRLRPKHAPELCLSVGTSPRNGATASLDACTDNAAQRWAFSGHLVRNQANRNMVLDVNQQQGRIGVWSAHGNSNQQWGWSAVADARQDEDNQVLCEKPYLAGNLIEEGDFNDLAPWSAFQNTGRLEQVTQAYDCGLDNHLKVTDRSDWSAGATQEITDVIRNGEAYSLSLLARMSGEGSLRDTVSVALRLEDDKGVRWQELASKSITSAEYDLLEADFTPAIEGQLRNAALVVYGPEAGRDFLIDELVLQPQVIEAPMPELASDFEADRGGWRDVYGALATRSDKQAATGSHSLKITHRRDWYAGTKRNVNGLIAPNQQYRLRFDAFVEGGNSQSQAIDAQLLFRDGSSARWSGIVREPIAASQWQAVEGVLELIDVNGEIDLAELHIFGPEAGVDFYIDNLTLEAVH